MAHLSRKYIREYEWGLLVDIRRSDRTLSRRFCFRLFPSADATWRAAAAWRDYAHLTAFGVPVTSTSPHVVRRRDAANPELPPGISMGYSARRPTPDNPATRKPLYYVVTYRVPCTRTGRTKLARKRFNFEKLGKEQALEKAMRFRAKTIGDPTP